MTRSATLASAGILLKSALDLIIDAATTLNDAQEAVHGFNVYALADDVQAVLKNLENDRIVAESAENKLK